jgi:pimeloyl-ACP methyl ester carboxylesterase
LPADSALPQRVVVLIHGLDEPGSIFDDLAPALVEQGFTPLYFEYPNDQHIADSADLLHLALLRLKNRRVERADLVCHSMGGLVALDCLTRDTMYSGDTTRNDRLPDIDQWITVGTPFRGSPFAGLRLIAEWREQAVRWTDAVTNGGPTPNGTHADGSGEAGEDLAPDSEFLTDLNLRPFPTGARLTVIYGVVAPGVDIGGNGEELGDGVVPVWSAIPEGATDVVQLGDNHRAMLKSASFTQAARNAVGADPRVAPAIPIILDRLTEPEQPSDS